ncbi:MAG: AbrB/MazE/SpoVT family DNA-binding domain-containing protein [Nanoarchaeota archaeon]|nr:AbrB/MazE/SpoVT family DNA-binding domain-containing protein [Nanoarchaeota archaeon]
MIEINTKIKKWGNSLATVIPKDIAEKANLKVGRNIKLLIPLKKANLEKRFGRLKNWKKSTEQIMREIDEGW